MPLNAFKNEADKRKAYAGTGYYPAHFSVIMPENTVMTDVSKLDILWKDFENYEKISSLEPNVVSMIKVNMKRENKTRMEIAVEFRPVTLKEPNGVANDHDGSAITVTAFDMNLGKVIDEYKYRAVEFSNPITAPAIKNMEFVKWEDGTASDVRNLRAGDDIYAFYRPIINSVEVTFSDTVKAGAPLPVLDSTEVTVTHKRRIDNASVRWLEPDLTAKHGTAYAAHIRVSKSGLRGTDLDSPDGESVSLAGAFSLAADPEITVKTADGSGDVRALTA